jgi:hypothetical protein
MVDVVPFSAHPVVGREPLALRRAGRGIRIGRIRLGQVVDISAEARGWFRFEFVHDASFERLVLRRPS